jgi:hypothetical protein
MILPSIDLTHKLATGYRERAEIESALNDSGPVVLEKLFDPLYIEEKLKKMKRFVHLVQALILCSYKDPGFVERTAAEKIAVHLWRLQEIEKQYPLFFLFAGVNLECCDIAIGLENLIYLISLEVSNFCEVLLYHANKNVKDRIIYIQQASRKTMDRVQQCYPSESHRKPIYKKRAYPKKTEIRGTRSYL